MDLGITGKRALVLAASRGLGLGIATALAAEGVHVLICGRTEERLKANVEDMDAEKLYTYFQSMVVRLITLTNALMPLMKTQGFGRVLTVASSGVFEPIGTLALSNTLRGALVGWNKTLASEVASYGITANMILPGRIHTDRIDELDGANAKRQGTTLDAVRENSIKAIPAGRLGRVEEFGAAAAFLCSVPASYVTGTMLRVDGGAAKSI